QDDTQNSRGPLQMTLVLASDHAGATSRKPVSDCILQRTERTCVKFPVSPEGSNHQNAKTEHDQHGPTARSSGSGAGRLKIGVGRYFRQVSSFQSIRLTS